MNETFRHVTIADLGAILAELDSFWGERDTAFLHHALYVHEFGETSVLAEGGDGRILGYLLGLISQDGTGYVHLVAVRRHARGAGLARRMYERFEQLARSRGAHALKAIATPQNHASRAFHEAMGFDVEEVAGYTPSGEARLVFTRELGGSSPDAPCGAGAGGRSAPG